MIDQFLYAVKYVMGLDKAARGLTVFPDDTFIVSFPRSGNTWTRFLIANLICQHEAVTFANIEGIIPDIYAQSKKFLKEIPRPRVLKSHEYFDPRYKRVIYIVRDPRDVALSSYHFHRKQRQIEEGYPIDRYVARFIAGTAWNNYGTWAENVSSWLATRVGSQFESDNTEATEKIFGSWGQNVASWLATRANGKDFLLLRYEDMLRQPVDELRQIAQFLQVDAAPERIIHAVEMSSAEHMRKLDKNESHVWVMTKDTRPDIPFVGNAVSSKWRNDLSEAAVAAIESAWGPLMRSLGYELATTRDPRAP